MGFIVLDGLDASGKSTQGTILSDSLKRCGKTVLLRIHPSEDNVFGRKARMFLLSKGANAHFSSAVFYMLDVLRSVLLYSWQKYDFIIFVRYLMGTAYLPYPLDKILYRFFASTVPMSRCMFFLDLPPEIANRRIKENRDCEKVEMFEDLENLRRIRTKALALVLTDNWNIINGNRPIGQVQNDIVKKIGLQCEHRS